MSDRPSQSTGFTQFYEAHLNAAFSAAARRVGPTAAEDIVAEAFTLAWQKDAASLEFQRGRAWLLTTVFNLCRNEVRAEQRARLHKQTLGEQLDRLPQQLSPDTPPAFDAAWNEASDADRELLGLVYHDDLSVADAANALGISEQAARTRLSRARSRLRTQFLLFKDRSVLTAKEA